MQRRPKSTTYNVLVYVDRVDFKPRIEWPTSSDQREKLPIYVGEKIDAIFEPSTPPSLARYPLPNTLPPIPNRHTFFAVLLFWVLLSPLVLFWNVPESQTLALG